MAHRPAASPPRADTQQASASPPRAGELIPSPRPSPARLSLSPRQAAGSPRTEERPTGEARSAGEERADAQAEGTRADEEPSDDAQRADQEPADSPLRAQATPSEEAGRPTVEGAATEEPEAAAATFPEVPELSSAGSMRSPIDAQPIRIDASQVIFTSFFFVSLPSAWLHTCSFFRLLSSLSPRRCSSWRRCAPLWRTWPIALRTPPSRA